jgi:hypothetical protein
MPEKVFNNILLILILLLLANYLSSGSLIETIKKYINIFLNRCNIEGFYVSDGWKGNTFKGIKKSTTPQIVYDADFKQNYQKNYNLKDDPNMRKLYHFLQSIVVINHNSYELSSSNNKAITISQNDKDGLYKFINKSLNCGDFKFTNLAILDSLIYFENASGKELRPFRLSGDFYINNLPIGKITLHIEMFIRLDTTFYGPMNSGFPTFTRIKLIRKDKIATPVDFINNNNTNDTFLNASDDSLIPDSINFSTEETCDSMEETEE